MLFHRHRILLIDLQNMSASGKSKPYRQKVKCSVCKKLVDSDYKEKHASSQHKKEKVVFSVVVSKNQTKIAFQGNTSSSKLYTTSTCTSVSGEVVSSSKSVCTSGRSKPFSQVSGGDDANLDDGVSATAVDTVIHEHAKTICGDVNLKNSDDDISVISMSIDEEELSQEIMSQVEEGDNDTTVQVAATTVVTEETDGKSFMDDDDPLRPKLSSYAPQMFSNENFNRDFQVSWFDKYSWLGFSVEKSCGYCYACERYGSGHDFEYRNWKKPERLKKHTKSDPHKLAMVKWMSHRAQMKSNKSIISMMDKNHLKMVEKIANIFELSSNV